MWKSVNGGPWSLLSGSPAPDDLDERFSLAIQTENEQHVLVGGSKGLFESIDGGVTWSQLFASLVLAVAIDDDGRVFAGVDDSIAVCEPGSTTFTTTSVGAQVTAIAISDTKVWARTEQTLIFSATHGEQWSLPISIALGPSI